MNYKNILTTCPYCGAGCNYFLQVFDDEITGVSPYYEHEISKGKLCIKGWYANEFVNSKERLTNPLMKKDGKFVEISWDTALDIVAKKLKSYVPSQVATLSSAKVSNEENYLMQKFARVVLGTNNVDHCARLCHASTVVGLMKSFGSGAMTNTIPELAESKCIFVIGSNTLEQHPLVGRYIIQAKEKDAKIILADIRKVPMAKFADIHLKPRPGSDVALLNGLAHVIINENLHDKKFIEERTEGFDQYKELVQKYTPEYVEKITWVPKELIIEAARLYFKASPSAIIYSMGITQHTTGVDNVVSIANLAILTGNIGKTGTGVNPLRGQSNVQGACDVGALPNVFPGYQSVADEAIRKKFEDAWHVKLPPKPGLPVTEMINEAGKGNLKAMYIMGENPMISDPNIRHVKESLQKLDFLVVQNIFMSETAQLADIVLPAASYAEKDGTITTTDRRVQLIRKAIEPIGQSLPDWKIICNFAKKMGSKEFEFNHPSEIMDEIASLAPIYGGISFERIYAKGLHWPCPNKEHPGTPVLHKEKFTRGKGAFIAIEFKEPAELPDDEFPLILTTGRVIFHFHTGTMSRRTKILNQESPTGFVEIHPDDAKKLGIFPDEIVKVKSRRGEIEIRAYVTDKITPGVVFIPFHYAECAANVLTNPALDPVAKIPEFKACACRIEKIKSQKNKSQ